MRAFTVTDASRLTELSVARLRRWARDGFFPPSLGAATFPAFYSFRDLVGLRTLAELRRRKVSRQFLREAGHWLKKFHDQPWSTLRFRIGADGEVAYDDPSTGAVIALKPLGQRVAPAVISLEQIAAKLERDVIKYRARSRRTVGKVEKRRGVQGNEACIAGTRIPVTAIVELANAGMTNREIVEQYPSLKIADIKAAVEASHRRAG